jgi:hypothetical protein
MSNSISAVENVMKRAEGSGVLDKEVTLGLAGRRELYFEVSREALRIHD